MCLTPEWFEVREVLVEQLGKHKMGMGGLYLRRLSEVDLSVLEQLVVASVAAFKQRYGAEPGRP